MTRRAGALCVVASAISWLTCSAPPEVLPPTMFVAPRPRAIDDQGMVSAIQVTVADTAGTPRSGSVTLTAAAGAFEGGGLTATFDLDSSGRGSANWSCEFGTDTRCEGSVRIEARWESGVEFLVQVVRISVGPPDAGSGDADGGGGEWGASLQISAGGVYLLGTLAEGACGRDALADPRRPTQVAMGFGCYVSSPKLSGASLYYLDSFASGPVYRFVPDPPVRTTSGSGWTYPTNPRQNDAVVPTPPCADVSRFFPSPDGRLLYQCASSDWYMDGQQVSLPASSSPVALGSGRLILLYRVGLGYALSAPDGGATPLRAADGGALVLGTPTGPFRSNQQGFWLVSGSGPRSRYLVRPDGTATSEGQYAALPAGFSGSQAVLDSAGKLVLMGTDAIAEVPLSPATSSIIYTEANATPNNWDATPPRLYVKIHISDLVTGP